MQDQLPSEVSSEVDRIPATEKSTIDQSKLLITEVDDNVVLHTLSSEAERVEVCDTPFEIIRECVRLAWKPLSLASGESILHTSCPSYKEISHSTNHDVYRIRKTSFFSKMDKS